MFAGGRRDVASVRLQAYWSLCWLCGRFPPLNGLIRAIFERKTLANFHIRCPLYLPAAGSFARCSADLTNPSTGTVPKGMKHITSHPIPLIIVKNQPFIALTFLNSDIYLSQSCSSKSTQKS